MTRRMTAVAATALALSVAGCGFIADLIAQHNTTVRLVNNADYEVQVTLYYDERQEIPRELLTEVGTRMDFTLAPGQVTRFRRDCDELQAVVIADAELHVMGESGPRASSKVLRDGEDFGCGDTIVFTFDHSAAIVDFDVSVAVEKGQLAEP